MPAAGDCGMQRLLTSFFSLLIPLALLFRSVFQSIFLVIESTSPCW
jgi:hypothetical protein